MDFTPLFDDKVLLEGGGAHPGEVGDDVPLAEGGHGPLLLGKHVGDALGVGLGVFLFPGLHRVRARQQVVVDSVQDASPFGTAPGRLHDGGDGGKRGPRLLIQNGVGAPPWVDGVETVPRHPGHLLSEDPCRVDDQGRIYRAPVGGDGFDLPVLHLHGQNRRVQRHFRPVLHRVFPVGDGQAVGADTAGGGVGHREFEVPAQSWLPPSQLRTGNDPGIGDAVVISAPQAVQGDEGSQPALVKAHVLPHPAEGYVQLPAHLIVHGVPPADIAVLQGALSQIHAGVDLAVIAPGGMEGQVRLLIHQQNVQLPLGQLPGNGRAGNAAADDERVRPGALQHAVPQVGQAHGLSFGLRACDVVDHMNPAVLHRRQLAGLHHIRPAVQLPGQHNAAIPQLRPHRSAKTGGQLFVYLSHIHGSCTSFNSQQVGQTTDLI